ncbi:hypothetical protein A0H81_04815 [Grifola frondosa]|uniref:F-box domain-containing protein n=1 Tax=Grifola frondosa TaxID=5627 RepID=A0A1C7ME33_GRIFR|nr:hypothetical protein A0H81_04815 [Grifola frondosa]
MPMDIFFEVMSKLKPLDILHLSRVSKDFRSMLMSKTAKHIWKAARLNIPDFPDCPPDLPEPRYATLVFERYCDGCGVGRASKVDYSLRMSCSVKRGKTLLKRVQYKEVDDQIFQLLPIAEPRCYDDSKHHAWDFYYKPECEKVANRYMVMLSDEGLPRFVEERKAIATLRHTHNEQLLDWECDSKMKSWREGQQAQRNREASIKANLSELASRADTTNLEFYSPKIEAILQHQRQLNIERDFRIKWRARLEKMQLLYKAYLTAVDGSTNKRVLPNFADTIQLPSFAALLVADEPSKDVTQEQFDTAIRIFLIEAESYTMRVKRDLVRILASGSEADQGEEENYDLSILDKPIALFLCCEGSDSSTPLLTASELLEHWQHHATRSWSAAFIKQRHGTGINTLLSALGLPSDSSITTIVDLAESGEAECACGMKCGYNAYYRRLETLLHHIAYYHYGPQSVPCRFKFLDTNKTTKMERDEKSGVGPSKMTPDGTA